MNKENTDKKMLIIPQRLSKVAAELMQQGLLLQAHLKKQLVRTEHKEIHDLLCDFTGENRIFDILKTDEDSFENQNKSELVNMINMLLAGNDIITIK